MEKLTDEQIMKRVADGDLDLLTVLFDKYHRHVYRFLFKMSGDHSLSEDLTQEIFYKLIKYRHSYKEGKFISWLFTIARNSLSTHYSRTKMKFQEIEESRQSLIQDDHQVELDYRHMHFALNKLSPDDKELLTLCRLQEIGYEEVADILGSTPGAVKTKACRALQKLRKYYFEKP